MKAPDFGLNEEAPQVQDMQSRNPAHMLKKLRQTNSDQILRTSSEPAATSRSCPCLFEQLEVGQLLLLPALVAAVGPGLALALVVAAAQGLSEVA